MGLLDVLIRRPAAAPPVNNAPPVRSIPVAYVNLDHRPDRRWSTERLWRHELGMADVTRIPGVIDTPPARGCSRAHLNALTMLQAHPAGTQYVILAEDDVVFVGGNRTLELVSKIEAALSAFADLKVLFLTASMRSFTTTGLPGVVRLRYRGALAMPAIVIRRNYLPTLKKIYEKAIRTNNAHDRFTQRAQGRGGWYAIYPQLLQQAAGYSDIEKRNVNFK